MPYRMAALAYPAFAAALFLSRPNAVAAFEKVNAFSPAKSRRPESLGVRRKLVKKAVDKGLLIPVGDGRYYLDEKAVRKSDIKKMFVMGFILVSGVGLMILMW